MGLLLDGVHVGEHCLIVALGIGPPMDPALGQESTEIDDSRGPGELVMHSKALSRAFGDARQTSNVPTICRRPASSGPIAERARPACSSICGAWPITRALRRACARASTKH